MVNATRIMPGGDVMPGHLVADAMRAKDPTYSLGPCDPS